jgi:hypothetical protein
MTLGGRGWAFGGEPVSKPSPAWWPAHGVLIPAVPAEDGQTPAMRPSGEKYQVPEALYDALKRLAAAGAEEPQGWLLGGATYRGAFAWQSGPDRLVPGEIQATFDLEALGSSVRVRLPFGEPGPSLLPDGVVLDGRPVQYELQQNALVFRVAERGSHRLELSLMPTVERSGTLAGFRLPIPRLAISRMELTLPPDAPTVDERAPLGPRGAYGKTKLAAEAEVRRAVEQWGVDAVIARSFQHTGPRQGPEMMLPHWCQQLVAGGRGPIEVYTVDAFIDLSDVRDVVRAYRLLVERGARGEVYNVGSGVCRRSGDVLAMLQKLAGQVRPVVEIYPGQKHNPIAEVSRLAEQTGWRATIPLEATVADTLAWWRQRM